MHKTANSIKIGFIYYGFYPVSGGASVHGYNLAKELNNLGYELYKLNGASDPYTHKMKNPISGLFWILSKCDLIYIRMDYFLNLRNLIALFALLSRKKIIVEINSPSDELHLFGRGKRYIGYIERVMAAILKRTDAIITVSEPLKEFCQKAMKLRHVHVIENGGEVFEQPAETASGTVQQKISEIRNSYSKIVVWSGSANRMQDFSLLDRIIDSQRDNIAIVLIVKEDDEKNYLPEARENLFIFKNLSRNDVKYIISESDIGLALYSNYPWSRWGFYNSSLKMFEYLNNGLLTITNTTGTEIQRSYPNFRNAKTEDEIIRLIEEFPSQSFNIEHPRTWKNVAGETSEIIQKVVN